LYFNPKGITMTNAVIECILSRSAAKYYDHAARLSDDEIHELVRIGSSDWVDGLIDKYNLKLLAGSTG
jgi:hypothetical protein